jgi:hypothetical protein
LIELEYEIEAWEFTGFLFWLCDELNGERMDDAKVKLRKFLVVVVLS